ncbi:hypothetical protein OKE80_00860 [Riemerella anatipestifer]|uniref:Uncharacterized protein n=1 Tax=Riemerella anatipestifer TaxID=34085 RepID=A0A1A5HM37_RIEAN|nr:hypothetical protein [Riemerella anatipestifer]AQY21473.1 hypothetical protein AB406_0515 [Riemerella anatipestifer]AZZ58376.1 hypothetical protein AWB57_04615 [Riemerella anatipestifer]MCO7317754.1 hypothetical protein [Riemerella anatipestifer]MCW0473380.1 hypothetical protein [Riemerella anatipestifer]MCW0510169.1 hypothetical protein [Riemerella anatipestifer]
MQRKGNKISPKKNIDLNIESKFKFIDDYLPRNYTGKVIKKLGRENLSASTVRGVRKRKSGDLEIIRALYDVAQDAYQLINE